MQDARPPRDTWIALLRAAMTFTLALPFYWLFVALVVVMQGEDFGAGLTLGAVAALFAATIGALPMIALHWALFHFTLPRAAA